MHDAFFVFVARLDFGQVAGLCALFGHVQQSVYCEDWLAVVEFVVSSLSKIDDSAPAEIVVLVDYVDESARIHKVNYMSG